METASMEAEKVPDCDCGRPMTIGTVERSSKEGDVIVAYAFEGPHCGACGEYSVTTDQLARLELAVTRHMLEGGRFTPANLKYARKSLGYTRVQFGAQVGIDPEAVQRAEQGEDGATAMRLWDVVRTQIDKAEAAFQGQPLTIRGIELAPPPA